MANALSDSLSTPPPPDLQGQAVSSAASALQPQSGAAGNMAPGGQTQTPAPTHQQTVAALRHFDAIERELSGLLADPDLGKSNLKSKIIDGAAKLIAQGIMSPADAVVQLGEVPMRPFDQRKWVEMNFAHTIQAANDVLTHHRMAFAGMPAPQQTQDQNQDHIGTIAGLMDHYNGLKNAG